MVNRQTGRRKRCKFHGGASTGPRTAAGKARQAAAVLKHGKYTKAAKEAKRALRAKLMGLRAKTEGSSK
jgi:hypothetical protein